MTAGGRQGRTQEWGRSRCISSPDQGACVCVGGRGAWACGHIYCLFPPAPAPCAHTGGRDPRAQPTARWTFTLLCKQAGARLGYQLEFHPVNGTRSLSRRAAEHLPSSPAPCPPMGTPVQQVNLGHACFIPAPGLSSPSSFPLEQDLAGNGDARGWAATTLFPARAGSYQPVPMWQ